MHPALEHAIEPFGPLDAWMREAWEHEPRVPDAVQVATVDGDGRPTVRTVLLKEWGPTGLVFYTNLQSRKARHLAERPHVSMVLHWKSLERQVLVEGVAHAVSDATADAYFATRPRGSQLSAWASRQSSELASREVLEQRMAEVTERFAGQDVPRPDFWSGFRVTPRAFEFWQGHADRLHDRVRFDHEGDRWKRTLRYP